MNKHFRSGFARSMMVCAVAGLVSVGAQGQQAAGKPAAPADNRAAAAQKQTQQVRRLLASNIVGMSVRGAQGNNIGQVEDLAIDMKTGQVRYAVLAFDPGFLSGERMVPIPMKELRMGNDRNSLVYQKNKEQLERIAMNKSEWNDELVRNKERLAKIDLAWGMPPFNGTTLVRASNLMDKEVQNKAGENIGEIEDLVISMDQGKVHYAMLEFERGWLTPERTVAVPTSLFGNPAGSGDELVIDVTKDRAKEMKGLTREQRRNPEAPELVAIVERHFVFLDPTKGAGDAQGASMGGKNDPRASGAPGASGSSGTPASQKQ